MKDGLTAEQAICEERCNACQQPRSEWAPVCPKMYVGDWTHYHSPEFWRYRAVSRA